MNCEGCRWWSYINVNMNTDPMTARCLCVMSQSRGLWVNERCGQFSNGRQIDMPDEPEVEVTL